MKDYQHRSLELKLSAINADFDLIIDLIMGYNKSTQCKEKDL